MLVVATMVPVVMGVGVGTLSMMLGSIRLSDMGPMVVSRRYGSERKLRIPCFVIITWRSAIKRTIRFTRFLCSVRTVDVMRMPSPIRLRMGILIQIHILLMWVEVLVLLRMRSVPELVVHVMTVSFPVPLVHVERGLAMGSVARGVAHILAVHYGHHVLWMSLSDHIRLVHMNHIRGCAH
jgi:hypothetical protein